MNDKKKRILEILATVTETPQDQLDAGKHLRNDLKLDSAQALDLLATIEEEFEIEIDEMEATRLETVGDVLAFADKAA